MAQTPSTMLPLGTPAPAFSLPDVSSGRTVTIDELKGSRALLVMFICNHCPFVKHIRAGIAKLASDYRPRGVAVVAISSNDPHRYPEDGPAEMAREVIAAEYTFPYLFDEQQDVAKAYRAACTPDFFLFDSGRRLIYRGQFDDSRPGNGLPVTGEDLRDAIDAVLEGRQVPPDQYPSIGCNIKWRAGAEPDYFKSPR